MFFEFSLAGSPVANRCRLFHVDDDTTKSRGGGTEQSRVGEAAGRRNCPEAVPEEQRGRKRKYVPLHEN
jgi:hypothetical protein